MDGIMTESERILRTAVVNLAEYLEDLGIDICEDIGHPNANSRDMTIRTAADIDTINVLIRR